MSESDCAICGRKMHPGMTFVFRALQGEVAKCLRCSLLHRPMLRRSLLTAVVVGTVLALINQGETLLSGSWDLSLYWKVPLTFSVPFLVVLWGALGTRTETPILPKPSFS